MATHVKVLGALNIILGGMGLITALMIGFIFSGAAVAVGASGDADAAVAIPIIGLTGMAAVALLTVWSLPGIVIGIGLVRLRPWARIGGIVVSILSLIVFPFGTILGVYGLWVLFSKDTEGVFTARPVSRDGNRAYRP
jgi:hypothetical protein